MKFKRRFYRKFRYNHKRSFLFIFLFLLCLSFGLGYSLISTDLNIFGTTVLKDNRWSVYFDNIQEIEGSVSPTVEPEITDNTTVSFSAKLKHPGDKYEFLIDVVNDGTIDAKIGNISMSPILTTEQQQFFSYEITYESSLALLENQALDAGSTETLKVSFKYLEQEDNSLYPDTDQTFNVTLTINYVQGTGTPLSHPYLYNVLMNEAVTGGLTRKYTGTHHDSFIKEPSKDIYYWYGSNSTQGAQILDKNNVIFAGQCWQILRTTDTGGVKMIYNGDIEDGQCLSTRGNHVGYNSISSQNLNTSYYYGTSYKYDKTNNVFSLDGVITTGTIQTRQYTCRQTSENATCSTLYYVDRLKSGNSYNTFLLSANSVYSYFGKLPYNTSSGSLAYVGYMYNNVYSSNSINSTSDTLLVSSSLSVNYYYADTYDFNVTNPNKYTLTNPSTVSSTDEYASLVGKYTFRNNSATYSNTKILYIAGVSGTTMYAIELENGNNLAYYNYSYTYGDSYTDNGDGTYTIDNPITFNRSNYISNYSSIKSKYLCVNAVNNTCSNIRHISNSDALKMNYFKSDDMYIFANSFSYDSTTGKYTLSDNRKELWDTIESGFNSNLSTRHYTCFSASDECSTLSYVYYNSSGSLFYIKLIDGKGIEDALDDMLRGDDINVIDSTIKRGVDAWYERYLLDYSDYLEDTIFCNNRVQSNYSSNGWNPNGGSVTNQLWFINVSNLSCLNESDKFSIFNEKAKLKYKVGILSPAELLKGTNINKYLWLLSPASFTTNTATVNYLNTNGSIYPYNLSASVGVAPVISLKPKTVYSSGDGSKESPYVINTE